MAEMLDEHGRTIKVIHRNVEIALNLGRVKVERQRAAGASGFEQVRDELRGNWNARLVFAVLAGVAVVRQHGSDAPGGCAFECVNHQQ